MGTCGTEQAAITNSIITTCIDISEENRESEVNNEETESTTESYEYFKMNEIKEYKVKEKELNSSDYNKFRF